MRKPFTTGAPQGNQLKLRPQFFFSGATSDGFSNKLCVQHFYAVYDLANSRSPGRAAEQPIRKMVKKNSTAREN